MKTWRSCLDYAFLGDEGVLVVWIQDAGRMIRMHEDSSPPQSPTEKTICDEAADEIERLRRMTPVANVTLSGDAEYWKERAERAEAERDALRPDAERYRWIASKAYRTSEMEPPHWCIPETCGLGNDIDAAIDAARSGK